MMPFLLFRMLRIVALLTVYAVVSYAPVFSTLLFHHYDTRRVLVGEPTTWS